MKILTGCAECMTQHVTEGRGGETPRIFVDMNDTGVYRIRCPSGHETYTYVYQEKYELLFDSGVMALRDGYPREAVSSLAASVERFHEHCIRVFMDHSGVPAAELESCWRHVSNSSERQLGAFWFLYLQTYQRTPPVLRQKTVEFRNRVIHKGYIASAAEVIAYGDEMLQYIVGVLRDLDASHAAEIRAMEERRRAAMKVPADAKVVTMFRASVIERANHPHHLSRSIAHFMSDMPTIDNIQGAEALPMDTE